MPQSLKISPECFSLLRAIMTDDSVTPRGEKSLASISSHLEGLGFSSRTMVFDEVLTDRSAPHSPASNLYAKYGTGPTEILFLGHVDVVPPGDLSKWQHPPFAATIENGIIYGRGAVDMKLAIVAWIAALTEILPTIDLDQVSLSLLLTTDEEGIAINGIKKTLPLIYNEQHSPTLCVVGEPVSRYKVGDTIKIGARGSATFKLRVQGKQGHVAYHDHNDNPATRLTKILSRAISQHLDQGNEFFAPSNLEITAIQCDSGAENMVPGEATAQFNIRYGNMHTAASLSALIERAILDKDDLNLVEIKYHSSGDAFLSPCAEAELNNLAAILYQTTGVEPEISTYGGTSDARFIKDYCPVVEIGLIGDTAHQINEHCPLSDVECLAGIYTEIISRFAAEHMSMSE